MKEFHPVADLFPLMRGAEFDALCDDIERRGIRESIWLFEGKIIDGRNRARACEKVGRSPTYTTYRGSEDQLVSFVLSLNLHRRHLTTIDKCAVASKVHEYEAAAAKERQRKAGQSTHGARGKNPKQLGARLPQAVSADKPAPDKRAPKSVEKAADAVGIGARTFADYRSVLAKAPELAEEMAAGRMSIPQAKQAAKLPPETRERVVELVKKGEAKNVAAAARKAEDEAREERGSMVSDSDHESSWRIVCGNASEEIAKLDDQSIDLVVTDPPYGIDTHRTREGGHDYADGHDYAMETIRGMLSAIAPKLKDGAHLYVFAGYSHVDEVKRIIGEAFDVQDNPIVWIKNNHTMADFAKRWPSKHEYIIFARNGDGRRLARCLGDVIGPIAPGKKTGHSAEKPVELLSTLIEQSSEPGQLVIDPFCGSGSTGAAAMETGRSFLGIEIDQKWSDIARSICDEV